LYQAGAYVAILDLQDVPQDLKDSCGSKIRFVKTDLTNATEVENAVQAVVKWISSTRAFLGGIINSAGVASAAKVFQFGHHEYANHD
jgi:3-hydroxyacyl-CoA dehydrogenase/3-hydroxy-2-methylbutyryl-CoA dehydrogenase